MNKHVEDLCILMHKTLQLQLEAMEHLWIIKYIYTIAETEDKFHQSLKWDVKDSLQI